MVRVAASSNTTASARRPVRRLGQQGREQERGKWDEKGKKVVEDKDRLGIESVICSEME